MLQTRLSSEHAANACALTTQAFLQIGANAREKPYYVVDVDLQKSNLELDRHSGFAGGSLVRTVGHSHAQYSFYKDATPLFAIQRRLSNTARFGDLMDICLAHGGRSSSRLTHIALHDGDRERKPTY